MRFYTTSSAMLISTTITVSFFFILNLPISTGQGYGGSMQYLNFYNSSDCKSEPLISINSTHYNLTLSKLVSMKVNGMWEVGFCQLNSTPVICSSNASIYISSEDSCTPVDSKLNLTNIQIQAIRYGDLYQSNGTISLFGLSRFHRVNPKSPVDTKGLNSTSPMIIGSWFFTGNHEWALYEGLNYTGKETCLKPSNQVISKGYGFTYELDANLTINSVGYRCTGGTSGANYLSSITVLSNLMMFLWLMILICLN